ncbi:MAG TPA: glutamine-hydrolyzing GMP synthase [Opitutaceae bacterium]|nr:glutamine-hydrolyzing GMP synthase [Opitutaceae bacterium]
MTQTIAVLDFGSQYTQVIARRIRECQVYSKIYHYSTPAETLKKDGVLGIILSGGPSSVLAKDAPLPDRAIFSLGLPVLGICYGVQLMGQFLGGKVAHSDEREYGHGRLQILRQGALFSGLGHVVRVWNSHGDKLTQLPRGFSATARTENSPYAAIENAEKKFYGLQFHPEVHHTENGVQILRNFLYNVCGCRGDWSMANFVDRAIADIREKVGDGRVILGLSGGVDSSVAAALIHKAIGKQLTCVFVDNGLLRKNERDAVVALYKRNFKIDLRVADSGEIFLKKLKGVTDPEKKRKIIGKTFITVFEDSLKSIGKAEYLAQGTLYPDVIESVSIGGNPAAVIKSHHNVGGLPARMKLKLLEPLRELFKDEVRALGTELGLPREVVWRQPFPGPGLAVRVMGDIRPERLEILRNADAILHEEMVESGYYYKVWQSFCVFLPVQTVGVMGDERTYDYVIAVRVVESVDAMTADWARLPHDLLQKVASRIINEVKGVNRVVYDISSKPPATIEWE